MTVIEMPAVLTLEAVAAMGEADELHRYEMTDEGEVRIMMTPTPEHSRIVMRLTLWFARSGFTDEQLRTDMGIYTGGGRQPDLTVWANEAPDVGIISVYVPVDDLILAVEVIARSSRRNDLVDKTGEYARAGIPRYWTIEQDGTQPVTMRTLTEGVYIASAPVPLEWLLTQDPSALLS